jgi:hypothetical protein
VAAQCEHFKTEITQAVHRAGRGSNSTNPAANANAQRTKQARFTMMLAIPGRAKQPKLRPQRAQTPLALQSGPGVITHAAGPWFDLPRSNAFPSGDAQPGRASPALPHFITVELNNGR